ncbi:D-tagatose-1,6-bisphosphate aldolase subunit GatZ [Propionispora sp. 2/2-37]|uniref:class II D-tagatose-bisphosphate aldolase, non-catalytic subunit n=1 Tax=Propionispora sp. 2/2-37 TaxID=1677858 RepID=UPI0006BB8A76|nr:class II D-tagatose-bisphosphate aldolase, non-catalytic subunit [Propionispora sp. 2/2-37]CUH95002.1 D-tagatose-1,6-bisphosphate aldolase subunit GatZ [Propionispora sp. 2/2-37]
MNGMQHPLQTLVNGRKTNHWQGIYSVCSANEYVIEAALQRGLTDDQYILIEATANQVNQFGGYTGMKPADFRNFVYRIAGKTGFPLAKLILGGDHLGPLTWKNEPARCALKKSRELIREYVLAGFTKIHIDTSMQMGDDDHSKTLDTGIIAERGAILCREAEEAFLELKTSYPESIHPVYVIGSEVPVPGGSRDEKDELQVTKALDFKNTVETFKQAFSRHELSPIWQYVIAVVVQPGVEFGDEGIHEYNRSAAKELTAALQQYPGMVFEGHSTDYQTPEALKAMVEDGIAILKVGPALTFAMREALFALSRMEQEILRFKPELEPSNFMEILDWFMVRNPQYWIHHYHGSPAKVRYARKYSFSDRCRYYLPVAEVKYALDTLINNLKSVAIPVTLISQFMPVQCSKIRRGVLQNEPESLLKDRIINCLDDYVYAIKRQDKLDGNIEGIL